MNQDRILVLQDEAIFLLADGIGGHSAGEVAAQIAVNSAASVLRHGGTLEDAANIAHDEILRKGAEDANCTGMGTTFVGLVLDGGHFEVAWAGDSRAYRVGDWIVPLTTDHNLAQSLLEQHIISPDEARQLPGRSRLTRALGISRHNEFQLSSITGTLEHGDTLLLCSDGLHSLVTDQQIHDAFMPDLTLQESVDSLVRMALDAGGTDNISVIAVALV